MNQQKVDALSSLIQDFKASDENIEIQEIPERVVLLMGQTKAGKTTLLYYLQGKQLIREINQFEVWQMKPQATYNNARIGNQFQSATVYPNLSIFQGQQSVMIIDMPGFNDSRPNYRLLNLYMLSKTINLIRNVHICLVIPQQFLNGNDILRQLQKIYKLFNKNLLKSELNLSFIITKCENNDRDQIKQTLKSILQQILSEQDLQQDFLQMIQVIIKNNVYHFANKEPIVSQGIQLKQEIVKQNLFFHVEGQNKILSDSFITVMIGEAKITQFQQYQMALVKQIQQMLHIMFFLVENIIKIQFAQIFACFQNTQVDKYLDQSLRNLQQLIDSNKKYLLIKNLKYKLNAKRQIERIKFINICKIFQIFEKRLINTDLQAAEDSKIIFFNVLFGSLAQVLSLSSQNYSYLNKNFILETKDICNYSKTILQTILSTKFIQLNQINQKLIIKKQILKTIDDLINLWKENKNKVTSMNSFVDFASDEQINQYYVIQAVQIIKQQRKVSVLENIRDIKTLQASISHIKSSKIIHQTYIKPQQIDDKLSLTIQSIKSLQNTKISLYQLLTILAIQQKSLQIKTVNVILSKISNIFSYYGLYEEAIMFRMAFYDENGIQALLKRGIDLQKLSLSFIRQIMIPYYSTVSPNIQAIIFCHDYINHIIGILSNPHTLQKQMVQILKNLKENDIKSQKAKRERIQWCLIEYLIEKRDLIYEQVSSLQLLYEKSIMKQLQAHLFIKLSQ